MTFEAFKSVLVVVFVLSGSMGRAETFSGAEYGEPRLNISSAMFGWMKLWVHNQCPPAVRTLSSDLKRLEAEYKATDSACEKSALAKALADQQSQMVDFFRWMAQSMKDLIVHGDYRSAVVHGLYALQTEMPFEKKDTEDIRFLLLQAQFLASMKMGSEKDSSWLQYGLGFGSEKLNPVEACLRYFHFWEDFPDSKHLAEVQRFNRESLSLFADYVIGLSEGKRKSSSALAIIQPYDPFFRDVWAENPEAAGRVFRRNLEVLNLLASEVNEDSDEFFQSQTGRNFCGFHHLESCKLSTFQAFVEKNRSELEALLAQIR